MRTILLSLVILLVSQSSFAQSGALSQEVKNDIGNFLTQTIRQKVHSGRVKIDSVSILKKEIHLFADAPLSYIMYTAEDIKNINSGVVALLPADYKNLKLKLFSDGYLIDDYVPTGRKDRFQNKVREPLVRNVSRPNAVPNGLVNRHLVIWQSHGWYYNQKETRWKWQRARVFQTVEDMYTQSYVLPYLVPMLEKAGGNVLIPRERDTQRHELIIDNDRTIDNSIYKNVNGKESWTTSSEKGFAHLKDYYLDGENPFEAGTYQLVKTISKGAESTAEWTPQIPERGSYAVYISYKTVRNSAADAKYTVRHLGGKTDFLVNQTMGGGTWIYLGTFDFEEGSSESMKVELSNLSKQSGKIITADAVKIGGGMGNIARLPHPDGLMTENTKSSENIANLKIETKVNVNHLPETSSYPRYTEAARYWLQWAGAPDSIYTKSMGQNDYTDDYQSRALWTNYIAGGSTVLPKGQGLNIPVDLAFAFHTDAGTTFNDSIIGTLGICMTHHNDEKFENGKSRILSRDLTQSIMQEIEQDIRTLYDSRWTTRHIWNKSYAEARIPEVPTMLLELLSHQNFADMRYGLDPRFQFSVSRAIYKGMLKHVSRQYNQAFTVQPLPVNTFSLNFVGDTQVELQWQPTADPLESTATPNAYIVYTRAEGEAFDNGILIKDTSLKMNIVKDKIYSYKITAVNEGGESFPSEVLSVCRKSNEKGNVLIVNGFDRLSAPHSFGIADSIAGFVDAIDHGVPYINQYNYIGSQKEYRRPIPWMSDDASGFGDSYSNHETMLIAGNTFDYPLIHGKAIASNGYSFISTSRDAVTGGQMDMNAYQLVDLILGKQKQTKIGRGEFGYQFKTFPTALQTKIKEYCTQGGNIFVSGAFVGSDLWDTELVNMNDHTFANEVLRYQWRVGQAAKEGKVKTVASPYTVAGSRYEFYDKLNTEMYVVESPDGIEPFGNDSHTIFRYVENNLSAGIASSDGYKTLILGFPFESVKSVKERNLLMDDILMFMSIN